MGRRGPRVRVDAGRARRPRLRAGLPLRPDANRPARPPVGEEARAGAGRPLALRPDPPAQAPDHLSPGRPGVPAEPGAVYGGAPGRRLGGYQAVRGDGPGGPPRTPALPDPGPPRPPAPPLACPPV